MWWMEAPKRRSGEAESKLSLMSQGHVHTLCSALILLSSSLNDHIPLLFLVLSLSFLIFLWYNLSEGSGTRSNHSTPHSHSPPIKGPSGPAHDMFSVLKKPTTTPTATATTYVTPPSDVTRPDAAPRDKGLPVSSMNEQYNAVKVPQSYDAFLVLDVEATCFQGTDFHWPNEIIVRYRAVLRSCSSIQFRNGQSVSSSGWTRVPTGWPVP